MRKKIPELNEPLHTALSINFSIHVIERYMEQQLLRICGISPIRFEVLNILRSYGGKSTPKDISLETYRAPHTISSLLDKLELGGLIQRKRSNTDRRSIDITLTKKGWNTIDEALPIYTEISIAIMSSLDNNQIDTLRNTLKLIRSELLDIASKHH